MGFYRLILAVLVALGHMGIMFFGVDLGYGVVAVISFLIISGFVMTALIDKNYEEISRIPAFFADRAMRLYPQFIFYLVLSSVLIYTALSDSPVHEAITPINLLSTVAMVPLGLYMFGFSDPNIIPQAWSLGLEMCFYLVIPFILIYRARLVLFYGSIVVFTLAFFGYIHSDWFGYRLLPGVLFIFLCGCFMKRGSASERFSVIAAWCVALTGCILIATGYAAWRPYNLQVAAGIVIGIPMIMLLSRIPYHRADEFLGNISYGVFLNHFLIIYAGKALGVSKISAELAVLYVASAFVLSGISYYLAERPVLVLRKKLRAKSAPSVSTPTLKRSGL